MPASSDGVIMRASSASIDSTPRADGRRGGAAAIGERNGHATPVFGIDVARQVTTEDQRVDQLARRLLGDPEPADHLDRRPTVIAHSAQDERAVSGKVAEPGRFEICLYGLAVAAAGGAEQCRDHDVFSGGGTGHPKRVISKATRGQST